MNKISIIIPTYNRIDSLNRTLAYLKKSIIKPYEIIIVDQSGPDFSERIRKMCLEDNNVKYHHLSKPSLTSARNVGIQMSMGDILLFMDDDVDVKSETLTNVIELFKDEDLVIVGGVDKYHFYHNSLIGYFFGKSKWSKRFQGHMSSGIYGRFPLVCEEFTPTEWTMGFCFAVRKDFVINNDCKFDENFQFYAYAEDLDFSYGIYRLAKRAGKKCIISNKLTVNHNVTSEYRTTTKKTTFMNYLHRYYICKKYNLSEIKYWWCNFGDLFYKIKKRDSLKDYFSAIIFLIKNKNRVAKGEFLYEKFM